MFFSLWGSCVIQLNLHLQHHISFFVFYITRTQATFFFCQHMGLNYFLISTITITNKIRYVKNIKAMMLSYHQTNSSYDKLCSTRNEEMVMYLHDIWNHLSLPCICEHIQYSTVRKASSNNVYELKFNVEDWNLDRVPPFLNLKILYDA
jgi:hypothetical protein